MDFNSIKIETKKNNVCFNFLRDHDFILPIDEQKTSFGQSLDDVFRVKSEHSGLIFNLQDILQLSDFLNCNIIQKSTTNPALFVKDNKLTSYFYILVQIEDIQIFFVFEFKSQNSTLTREQWYESRYSQSRECCLSHFLAQKNLTISSLKQVEKIPDTKLDLFCCFPKKFVDVETKGWAHILNYNESTVKTKFQSLNICLMKANINNIFGEMSVEYLFKYSSTSKIEKQVFLKNCEKFDDFSYFENLDMKTLLLEYFSFREPREPKCQDLLLQISLNDCSFKQYLISCLYTIYYMIDVTCTNKNQKLEAKSKLLGCSFYF